MHVTINRQDRADYEYYLERRTAVEPVRSALFENLLQLIDGRLTEEALSSELDPEVLGLLVEEEEGNLGRLAETAVLESLAGVQARRAGIPTERLQRAIASSASQIVKRVPDEGLRRVYASTGLSSSSCELLRQDARDRSSELLQLLLQPDTQTTALLETIVAPCLTLPEMESRYSFGGNNLELLESWIAGDDIRSLVSQYGTDNTDAEEFGSYIDDLFGYRLPWGLSGYLRIAATVVGVNPEDLSLMARSLPSMVRNGLPDPVSCWAMLAGVPMRRTAIQLAAAYLGETPSSITFEEFLDWLHDVSSERLRYEFGLESPILEDASRALSTYSRNRVLREFSGVESLLPRSVPVKGIAYEDRRLVAQKAKVGETAFLARDYDNLADRNAITVRIGGGTIGYVPRDIAQVIAPEFDTGSRFEATVDQVEHGPVPKVSVLISSLPNGSSEGRAR